MWGCSPSYDILSRSASAVNILLVEPNDPRTIIHTIARRLRHDKSTHGKDDTQTHLPPLNIYILESEPEVVARHLLLMEIFLNRSLPIRMRATMFLETFNSLLSNRCKDYIIKTGNNLRELIHDDGANYGESASKVKKLFDFRCLKQKQLDKLDLVLKRWTKSDECRSGIQNCGEDVESLRDQKIRQYYGDRYDCRENLCEWDYYSRVKDVASIIHIKQWKEWRMSGIAFEFGDAKNNLSNPTMLTSSTSRRVGDHGMHREQLEYSVDIVNSPYVSFGIEIDSDEELAKGLFEVCNAGTGAEQHRHNTAEVAMYNLIDFMWELETGSRYQLKVKNDIFSGLGETTETDEEIQTASRDKDNGSFDRVLESVKIMPLINQDVTFMKNKKKYHNFFDYVYLSHHSFSDIADVNTIASTNCTIEVETGKFKLPKKEHNNLTQEILRLAEDFNLRLDKSHQESKDLLAFNTLRFIL